MARPRTNTINKKSLQGRIWRSKNPEKVVSQRIRSRTRNQSVLHSAKRVPCQDCGGIFKPWQMDFDHRPGTIKSFSIAQATTSRSLESLVDEIAKCDVVCANCHRDRTYKRSHV